MATTYSASIQFAVNPSLVTDGLGTLTPAINAALALSSGTTAAKFNAIYAARLSADNSSGTTLDLVGGGLLQPDQSSFSLAEIVAVVVVNRDSTNNLVIGGGTNPVPRINHTLGPGGMYGIAETADPAIQVTGGASDNLKFLASASTVSFDVVILGRTA